MISFSRLLLNNDGDLPGRLQLVAHYTLHAEETIGNTTRDAVFHNVAHRPVIV